MAGRISGQVAAGIVALTLSAACGSERAPDPTDPGPAYSAAPAALGVGRTQSQVFSATGDLTQVLSAYRASLGGGPNTTAGEQATGRREVSWDGVGGALLNVDSFPPDFFNRVVPRGQVYATKGAGFRVSDNALADLNPAYAGQFAAFSPSKIFVAAGSREMTVQFQVAGSTAPALVNGFGVVFSDVDRDHSTTLDFFDARGGLLQRVTAPVRSDDAGFSFVGVTFGAASVARVRIRSGQAGITGLNTDISDGGHADLVAMDDFISGEPHAIR